MLCGSRNGLSELLLGSYTIFDTQNRLSEPLQASYKLLYTHNPLSESLQASYMHCLAVVKTDFPNRYEGATRFAVVKTDCPNLYWPPTQFTILRTNYLFNLEATDLSALCMQDMK